MLTATFGEPTMSRLQFQLWHNWFNEDQNFFHFLMFFTIFTDVLDMKSAAAKIVPKLLILKQKQRRMNIAQKMSMTFNDYPNWLKKVKTSDKSWVYSYGIETKTQSSQWKRAEEPRPKK